VPSSPEIAGLLVFLCLTALYGLDFRGLYWFFTKQPLLPPQRNTLVPWRGREVCLVVIIYFFLPAIFLQLFKHFDFFGLVDMPQLAAKAASDLTTAQKLAQRRHNLLVLAVATPFQLAAILLVLNSLSRTQPYQLGLTRRRFAANVGVGALAWVLITPVVFLVNIVVNLIYRILVEGKTEEHPLKQLVQSEGLPLDWVLMFALAMVAAPIMEELLFRGVLQKYFARRPWGGDAAMLAAFLLALLFRSGELGSALDDGDFPLVLHELGPALFVLALVPGLLWVDRIAPRWFAAPRRGTPPAPVLRDPVNQVVPAQRVEIQKRSGLLGRLGRWYARRVSLPAGLTSINTARACYGTAVLFAAVHATVWPSPIPLVLLAFALGWLAYRTQSLVGPMVFHALFNGVTCVFLLLPQPQEPEKPKGKPATAAVRRVPAASTSTAVPGSWLPRRR
jgi:membrane protease YdiL (CAAX protease family)